MRKTKIFSIIAAVLTIAVLFSSCGANSPAETEAPSITNPHESSASFKVAFLQYDNDYCSAQMRQAFIARMRTLGYDEAKMKFDILNAQGNAETLEKNVQSLSGSDYSLIVAAGTLTAKAVAKSGTALPCVRYFVTRLSTLVSAARSAFPWGKVAPASHGSRRRMRDEPLQRCPLTGDCLRRPGFSHARETGERARRSSAPAPRRAGR